MKWRPITNDNDILRDGDMFRIWQADQSWSNWARVEASIGLALRDFVNGRESRDAIVRDVDLRRVVEVRRPVIEEVCGE